MCDQFLVADGLSFEGDDLMRSSSTQDVIQTLDLFVSFFHLFRKQLMRCKVTRHTQSKPAFLT